MDVGLGLCLVIDITCCAQWQITVLTLCQWWLVFSLAIGHFWPLQNSRLWTNHQKYVKWLWPRPLSLYQVWYKSIHGDLWGNVWNITSFYTSFEELTYKWDWSVDCCAQTTWTRAIVSLFGVSLMLLSILGITYIIINLGGRIIVFKPNLEYWKLHIIETTASLASKFCAVIETTKTMVLSLRV